MPYIYNNSFIPHLTALISVKSGQLIYQNTYIKYNFEDNGIGLSPSLTPTASHRRAFLLNLTGVFFALKMLSERKRHCGSKRHWVKPFGSAGCVACTKDYCWGSPAEQLKGWIQDKPEVLIIDKPMVPSRPEIKSTEQIN